MIISNDDDKYIAGYNLLGGDNSTIFDGATPLYAISYTLLKKGNMSTSLDK